MELELHIDIYTIIMVHAALTLLLYQLSQPFRKVQNEKVRGELEKIMSDYTWALSAGDLIVWPVLITAFYPLYALIRLIFKRNLVLVARTFFQDLELLKITSFILFLWIISTLSALFHLWILYAIVFLIGLILLRHLYKKGEESGNK